MKLRFVHVSIKLWSTWISRWICFYFFCFWFSLSLCCPLSSAAPLGRRFPSWAPEVAGVLPGEAPTPALLWALPSRDLVGSGGQALPPWSTQTDTRDCAGNFSLTWPGPRPYGGTNPHFTQGSLRDRKPSPLNHRTQTRASQPSEGCEPAARRSTNVTHSGPTHTHTTLTECGRTDYGHVCDCSTRTPTPAHMIAHCKETGTYLHTAARGRFRASPNSPHHSGDLPTSTRARAPAVGREPAWSHQPQPIQNHPEFSTSSWTRVAGASEMGNTAHLFSWGIQPKSESRSHRNEHRT